MNNLFEIIFENGETYSGGDLINMKWIAIPKDKKISRLFYLLPSGDYLALGGYEKYYSSVEITKDFYGGDGKSNFEYIYVMGKKDKVINQYKINLKSSSIERKILKEEELKINSEYWR